MIEISPTDPLWSESLQVLTPPRAGDSLAGLYLRAARRNDLPSAEPIRCTRRHLTGPGRYTSPALFLSGSVFRLATVGELVGATRDQIEQLTIRPMLRLLDGSIGRSAGTGAAPRFRLCGKCCAIQEIPLLHLLEDVHGCVRHDRNLADRCSCGEPLFPFNDQEPAWTCHACGLPYSGLDAGPIRAREQERARADVYAALLNPPPGLPSGLGFHIGRVLRTRLLGRDTAFLDRPIIRAERRPGAWLLCEAIMASGLSVTEVLALAAERATHPPRRGESDNRLVSCPAPLCRGMLRVARAGTRPGSTAPDYVCRDCGTRFTDNRVTFSFEPVPGYPPELARRNAAQLAGMRQAVRAVVRRRRDAGDKLTVDSVLEEAGVPSSRSYRTARAGLVEIVDAAAATQLHDQLDGDLGS